MKRYSLHTSLLILTAYLGLLTANVYHYHSVNILINSLNQIDNVSNRKSFNFHSLDNCLVNLTYKNINSVIASSSNNALDPFHYIEYFYYQNNPSTNSHHLQSIKLRAPPIHS